MLLSTFNHDRLQWQQLKHVLSSSTHVNDGLNMCFIIHPSVLTLASIKIYWLLHIPLFPLYQPSGASL